MRTRFIETLTALAEIDPRITLVVGDLGYSVVEDFAARFPDRFFNAGVAEQNMTGMAAGLAMAGRVVVTYSIANFPTLRCLEQIRNDVCAHRLPVKIVAVGGGYAYGPHGYTHHALEDLGVLRTLPHMSIGSPADSNECEAVTQWLMQDDGPGYLRLGRNREPILCDGVPEVGPELLTCHRPGGDMIFVATGSVLVEALAAADTLRDRKISAGVLSAPVIKPFPARALLEATAGAQAVITVEEHCGYGGLGSAVAEVLAEAERAPRLIRCHAPEKVGAIGDQPYMRRAAGLDADALMATAERALTRRRRLWAVNQQAVSQ